MPTPAGPHYHYYAPGGPVTHNNHYYAAPAQYAPCSQPYPSTSEEFQYRVYRDGFSTPRDGISSSPDHSCVQPLNPARRSGSLTPDDMHESSQPIHTRPRRRQYQVPSAPPTSVTSVFQPEDAPNKSAKEIHHALYRVPVRYNTDTGISITDTADAGEQSTRFLSRLDVRPEAPVAHEHVSNVMPDMTADNAQPSQPAGDARGAPSPVPRIVIQAATDPSSPPSPASTSASSSPWSPPASAQSSPDTVYSAPLHDLRSTTSLVEPPVGELASRILSQVNERAGMGTSGSAGSRTVAGDSSPSSSTLVSINEGAAEGDVEEEEAEEINGNDPAEPLSLTYANNRPFTIPVHPFSELKSYSTPREYLDNIFALRRAFDSTHGLPSHPAIDIHTFDAHAALALECRLSQDAQMARELSEVRGRIVYMAKMEGGGERMWRLEKVQRMLEKWRERLREVARWKYAIASASVDEA